MAAEAPEVRNLLERLGLYLYDEERSVTSSPIGEADVIDWVEYHILV